jgi:ATP-dependent RNA helicase DDX41
MLALEEEMKLPVVGNEGPFGIILCPSRELARQTFDVVDYFCQVSYALTFTQLM